VFFKLLLLFVTVPLVELFLLLVISWYFLGPLATFGLVLITGIVGAWLAQWQGTRALTRIREDLSGGRMPTDAVTDAVLIFVAGAFLMTPGILTDLLGFTLLVPAGRTLVKYYLMRWFKRHFHVETVGPRQSAEPGDRIIDSYVVEPNGDSPPASDTDEPNA